MPTEQAIPTPEPTVTDIFANVHKSIRHWLAEVLSRLGAADALAPAHEHGLGDDLLDLLDYCERHLQHEEQIVRPALAHRLVPEAFDHGHPTHQRMINELRAIVGAWRLAKPQHQRTIGHALYLHFSVFVGDCLIHMAEEERVLLPLMQRTLGEAGLAAIHEQIIRALTPAELARSARRMLPAVDQATRKALTLGMLERAPRAAVAELLEAVRPALAPDAFAALMAIVVAPANPRQEGLA